MVKVYLSKEGDADFRDLPLPIMGWVEEFIVLLEANWPVVSGVKRLRGDRHGSWSKRHGDWRLLFQENKERTIITITRIDHRRKVYK
jgi:mRNA-degrading endonuclease RelE of RelBE toxin-antitoxin system